MAKKEISILKKQIERLEVKDFDLEAWKKFTIVMLARIFGNTSEKIRQIESIEYEYSSWSLRDTSGSSEYLESCKKLGRKILEASIEELETFARFGARLDEENRKVIEHGQRIRACLKQSEFAPVSVAEQIAVLLALTAELFDDIPLGLMKDAEQAIRKAATQIPAEVSDRLESGDHLSDEDRQAIIAIARRALDTFSTEQDGSKPGAPSGEKV